MVSNITQVYEALQGQGVTVIQGPLDAQWGARIALFSDPDGHTLQLTEIDWPRYFAIGT